jgi:hypothetical protein
MDRVLTRRWDVLDTRLIPRTGTERRIEWPCSLRTRMKFRALLAELVDLEQESQRDPDVQAKMEALREDIRSLPGFPKRFDLDRDLIVPVTTSTQR